MVRKLSLAALMIAALAVAAATALALPGEPFSHPGLNTVVSVSGAGEQGDSASFDPVVSAGGDVVVFSSNATNLVPGDTNGIQDVFAREVRTGRTERVSVADDESEAAGQFDSSYQGRVSADGRYVAFLSGAANLPPKGNPARNPQVYVRDRVAGTTEIVSALDDGTVPNSFNVSPDISGDGRYVVFQSTGKLVTADTDTRADVYVHDRVTGTRKRVNVRPDGAAGSAGGTAPAISGDGRWITFASSATDLVTGDENGVGDIFVANRETGKIELVSVSSDETQANMTGSFPAVSEDGQVVVWSSKADNLVPNDTNGVTNPLEASDIFARDRTSGTTERVSVDASGAQFNNSFGPSVSGNGRYVGFDHAREASSTIGTKTQAWLHDRVTKTTEMLSTTPNGSPGSGDAGNTEVDPSGRYATFESESGDLASGDVNELIDVFGRDRGPELGTFALRSTGSGTTTKLLGRVRVTGATLSEASDPAADAAPGAARSGGELVGGSVSFRPTEADLLVRWLVSSFPTVEPGAPPSPYTYGMSFSVGTDRFLVTAAPDGSFAFYNCSGRTCSKTGTPTGGIGTTGNEVRVSVDYSPAGLTADEAVTDVRLFAGSAAPTVGEIESVDEVALPGFAVPEPRVQAGWARAGVPESDVPFSFSAALATPTFTAPLAVTASAGEPVVLWARACLGQTCSPATALPVGGPAAGPTPTPTPSPAVTVTPEPTPDVVLTPVPSPSPSPAPQESPTPDASATPAASPTPDATATPTVIRETVFVTRPSPDSQPGSTVPARDDLVNAGREACLLPGVICGTPGRDVLRGTRRSDVILGFGGDDVIRGGGGDDLISGGAGRDRLDGGAGADTLHGGADRDKLYGRSGRDRLIGSGGADLLDGGIGRDRCAGGAGSDLLRRCP